MMRLLFRALRVWGDARALSRGRYGERVVRRHAHRGLARLLRRGGL